MAVEGGVLRVPLRDPTRKISRYAPHTAQDPQHPVSQPDLATLVPGRAECCKGSHQPPREKARICPGHWKLLISLQASWSRAPWPACYETSLSPFFPCTWLSVAKESELKFKAQPKSVAVWLQLLCKGQEAETWLWFLIPLFQPESEARCCGLGGGEQPRAQRGAAFGNCCQSSRVTGFPSHSSPGSRSRSQLCSRARG